MTDTSTVGAGDTSVFCQISGRDISSESCFQTQGQEGCFGCAASTRRCEKCQINFVAVAATGTCSQCTAAEIESEKSVKISAPLAKVDCQMMKRSISGVMCRSTQGQEGCRGCAAQSRICENCASRPVRFPQYGLCFTCSIKELGDGWQAEEPDRSVAHPHLRVVSVEPKTGIEKEKGREILPLAQEFCRIPLANIREPEIPVREKYDEEELFDLGDSMLNDGMIYPVILEPVSENFYEVVIGSRRVRAARYREQLDIPALILDPQSALSKLLLALAENIHRVDLDPFEEGKAFLRLMREYEMNASDIAAKTNKSVAHIKERIQLLSLPEAVQQLVVEGELSIRNAAVLARVPEKKRQAKLARESVTHRFAQNELRRRVSSEVGDTGNTARVIPYHVTPQKFAARSEEFVQWFKRAIPRLRIGETTLEDRVLMLGALTSLENQIRKVKELIKREKSPGKKKVQ